MYWLEGRLNLSYLLREPKFRPEQLTITIRYSDWWYWESDTPLRMSEDWLRKFCGSPGLRKLRVEYETLVGKKDEMMKIIERNKTWKLPVEDDEGHLSAEGTQLAEWKWNGTSKLGGKEWTHHGPGDTVEYVVVTDTWRYVERPMSEEDASRRETPVEALFGSPVRNGPAMNFDFGSHNLHDVHDGVFDFNTFGDHFDDDYR